MKTHFLYEHQNDAYTAGKKFLTNPMQQKAKVTIPTGGGKSLAQQFIMGEAITLNNNTGVYVVVAPRIQLALQLMWKSLIADSITSTTTFEKFGIPYFLPAALHSGGNGDDKSEGYDLEVGIQMKNEIGELVATIPHQIDNIYAGTSIDSIVEQYHRAKTLGLPLVVFATYHSLNKLYYAFRDMPEVLELIQFDECQYLVSEEFGYLISKCPFKKQISWTATEKVTASADGLGMNNVTRFGPTIYTIDAKTLIKRGIILPPRLFIINATSFDGMSEEKQALGLVVEAFKCQKNLNIPIPVKLVVNCRGISDITYIRENIAKYLDFPNVGIYSIDSSSGALINNAKCPDRNTWIKSIESSPNDAIVLHYDIISEGTDVDGLTATLMMRNSKEAKTLQQIGRIMRLWSSDKKALQDKVISVESPSGWIKPTANVIIGIIREEGATIESMNEDDMENVRCLVKLLRQQGFDPRETVVIHNPKGEGEEGDGDEVELPKEELQSTFSLLFEQIFNTVYIEVESEAAVYEDEYDETWDSERIF